MVCFGGGGGSQPIIGTIQVIDPQPFEVRIKLVLKKTAFFAD